MSILRVCIRSFLLVLLLPVLSRADGVDPAKAPGDRMSILVFPCESSPAVADLAQVADDLLVKAILEKKRFRVVEKEKLQQVVQEQLLSQKKLTDPEHSVRLGRIASAEALLATRLLEEGKSLRLTARVILTETGVSLELISLKTEHSSCRINATAAIGGRRSDPDGWREGGRPLIRGRNRVQGDEADYLPPGKKDQTSCYRAIARFRRGSSGGSYSSRNGSKVGLDTVVRSSPGQRCQAR
jgi:hypothetical protein